MARSLPPELRFADKIEVLENGCWQWRGALYRSGYGAFSVGRRPMPAHRFSYETYVAEIPAGLEIDHLCRNRACVNPDHLEPVTRLENLLRGETIIRRNAAKTHCPKGHEYTPENTRFNKGKGQGRACRRCDREARRLRRGD